MRIHIFVFAISLLALGCDKPEADPVEGATCASYGEPCSCSDGSTGCSPHSGGNKVCQCPGGDERVGDNAILPQPTGGDCSSYGELCDCSDGSTGCSPHAGGNAICQCPGGDEPRGDDPVRPPPLPDAG